MNDPFVVGGLLLCGVLVLIPVSMLARIIYDIIVGYREYKRAEQRRVTVSIPGLGDFSSTDNKFWQGVVREMCVCLDHSGPPSEILAKQVITLLDNLPPWTEKARQYIAEHEDISWLNGTQAFTVSGIEPMSDGSFILSLSHPEDPDGDYRVEFRDGQPVNCGRDD